ncbi:HAD-IA family hydrolase [Dictyobacter kobayashii]|uniref:Haloacid dehalogenase n=1 Tax=Dictyobacter kobayashii TaxID=2014872 RepID=A0A402AII4_9CHLR|nr:HAD-IA family hydrolase [Dictyobacter kobayashii]GCE18870.1 hypothetical protein KDK_26700 [Dictyobacter kobayashii]
MDAFLDYWFTSEHVIDAPLVAFIQQLRQQGVPCYLATQQEKYRTAYILEQMGFVREFDGMFSSAYLGTLKKDVAFFQQILAALPDLAPAEVLFWDDTPLNVAVARQAGIQAEVYTDFAHFQQTLLNYELSLNH